MSVSTKFLHQINFFFLLQVANSLGYIWVSIYLVSCWQRSTCYSVTFDMITVGLLVKTSEFCI